MITIAKPVIGEEEKAAVMSVLNSGMVAQGPKVKELEEQFAKYIGVKHAIAVSSGTAGLHTAVASLGIGKYDEVITVPFTFVATANSIIMTGAKPRFVDVREDTFCINIDQVKKAICAKTKAILAVDLYGQTCDYDALRELANKYNLKIIEDAAQAHGANYKGRQAGNLGDIGVFSFYATKNLQCAEGGMITTNDDKLADFCRRFRHHGQSATYEYDMLGYNYRMTDIQAAIALEQLKKLEKFNARRNEIANKYNEAFSKLDIKLPVKTPGSTHVYHQYTLRVKDRDAVMTHLKTKGIGCGIYYPKPLHLQPQFIKLKCKCPISEKLSKEVLSLPVHPSLTNEEVDYVISCVKEFYHGR
jgi:dTDP-4-amino-4,6-dideoxygalactose transaminase